MPDFLNLTNLELVRRVFALYVYDLRPIGILWSLCGATEKAFFSEKKGRTAKEEEIAIHHTHTTGLSTSQNVMSFFYIRFFFFFRRPFVIHGGLSSHVHLRKKADAGLGHVWERGQAIKHMFYAWPSLQCDKSTQNTLAKRPRRPKNMGLENKSLWQIFWLLVLPLNIKYLTWFSDQWMRFSTLQWTDFSPKWNPIRCLKL